LAGKISFWADVHALFLKRDISRNDLRQVIRRGLQASHGSYRGMLPVLRLPDADYKRLLNFLKAHDCLPDFREFRSHSGGSRPDATAANEGPGHAAKQDAD
jgi:hypothetical protein